MLDTYSPLTISEMQQIESFFAPLVKRKQEWEIMEN